MTQFLKDERGAKFVYADDRDAGHPHGLSPHRYFDKSLGRTAVKVQPGTHYVTTRIDEVITTTLGSCVSVCIRDREARIGGMNHFMLPESDSGVWSGVSAALRYGNHAMEVLINDILQLGGAKNRLELKIFGGANVLAGSKNDVGEKNIQFIRRFLKNEHMAPSGEHLGGNQARQIRYFPDTGVAKMKLLDPVEQKVVVREELDLKHELEEHSVEGDIDLF